MTSITPKSQSGEKGITISRSSADPRGFCLVAEQRLRAPRDKLFSFFADAENLQRVTPAWLQFSVLTPGPIRMGVGTRIDYRLRVRGVPIRWQSQITVWEPPVRFVDEQLRGPYRMWRHEHTFLEDGDGTLVRDQVDYRVPGGALVNWLLVATDLRRIFAYRHDALAANCAAKGF